MESKELKENNIDNKYVIEYTKVGDYYIPNLVLFFLIRKLAFS